MSNYFVKHDSTMALGICDNTSLMCCTAPLALHLILTFSMFSYILITGSKDVGALNKVRTLLSYPHCREPLDLRTGNNYLIMGASKDIYKDDQDQS